MNRKEAAELLPIIKAFSEGRTIEQKCVESWIEVDENCDFHFPANSYRIKPEPKYRPFKDAEECWNEMLKHEPFGWVKLINNKEQEEFIHCGVITKIKVVLTSIDEVPFTYDDMYKNYTFADGTPFGILEEE